MSEVDIENFDEKKPFSIHGYRTFFPLERPCTTTKRLICFVKDNIEVKQRNDLMSELFSSVWLEVRANSQKILICTLYQEFSDLTKKEKMSMKQQIERWKIFQSQVSKASKEGLILGIGDMNIDLEKLEESSYYQKKFAEEYQLLIGECGLDLLNFGITWSRNQHVSSALDHAFINKPLSVHSYHKEWIDYSDHYLICVNLKWNVPKLKSITTTSRDFRKLRNNPNFFLNELSKIEWDSFVNMEDVDDMVSFWSYEINKCLDFVAL